MTTVVAGILTCEGRVLICQRPPGKPHALKWEFPGGKVEAGESPGQALVRELQEELGIECSELAELTRYEFTYPERTPILLIFFKVPTWRGEIENKIFEAVAWEPANALKSYDFLDGDLPFLDMTPVLL